MTTKKCKICDKEIDVRGMSGHMKTHEKDGIPKSVQEPKKEMSYPENKPDSEPQVKHSTSKPPVKSKPEVKPDPSHEKKSKKESLWGFM